MTATTCFEALGTYAFLGTRRAGDLPAARRLAHEVLADVDTTCSRFREDSDLSRVNQRPGSWVEVDPLLAAAVTVARDAASVTDGLVHPLLGRQLVQLGYDRDFTMLTRCEEEITLPFSEVPQVDAWREIAVDPAGGVRIPRGTSLDLGATAKAWAADLLAATLVGELGASVVVSLGGDVRIDGPDHTPWQVRVSEHVEDPTGALIALDRGGLATSSTRVRRWSRGGVERHHLLDPRTGRPVSEVWRTVTATGSTCVAANTATTAAVVLGADAPTWLERHGVAARLVARDGDVLLAGDWPADAAPDPAPRRVA